MNRVGFYPGTFDPIHNGHTDVIGRAAKIVDRLVLGVAINAGKGPLFSLEERVAIVEEAVAPLTATCPAVPTPGTRRSAVASHVARIRRLRQGRSG